MATNLPRVGPNTCQGPVTIGAASDEIVNFASVLPGVPTEISITPTDTNSPGQVWVKTAATAAGLTLHNNNGAQPANVNVRCKFTPPDQR